MVNEPSDVANDPGALITDRSPGRWIPRITAFFVFLCSLLINAVGIGSFASSPTNPNQPSWPLALGLLSFGLPIGYSAWYLFQASRVNLRFHEHAVVWTRGRRRKVIAYDQIESIAVDIRTYRYVGIPIRSECRLKIIGADGTKIAHGGPVKLGQHKATGEPKDPLLPLIDRLATIVADRLEDQVLNGTPLLWARRASLSLEALTPTSGRYKAKPIPLTEITRGNLLPFAFELFRLDEPRPFLTLPTVEPNFQPGLIVFQRLTDLHDQAGHPGTVQQKPNS